MRPPIQPFHVPLPHQSPGQGLWGCCTFPGPSTMDKETLHVPEPVALPHVNGRQSHTQFPRLSHNCRNRPMAQAPGFLVSARALPSAADRGWGGTYPVADPHNGGARLSFPCLVGLGGGPGEHLIGLPRCFSSRLARHSFPEGTGDVQEAVVYRKFQPPFALLLILHAWSWWRRRV